MHMTYILTQFIKWINKFSTLTTVHRRSISRAVGPSPANVFHPRQSLSLLSLWSGGTLGANTSSFTNISWGTWKGWMDHILLITLHMNLHVQDFMESTRVRYYMFTPGAVILFGKSTMAFFTDQSPWRLLKSWYKDGGPEQGFRCCFANGLNRQSLVSSAAQASEQSERVKKKKKKKKNKQTNNNNKKTSASKLYKVLSNFIVN